MSVVESVVRGRWAAGHTSKCTGQGTVAMGAAGMGADGEVERHGTVEAVDAMIAIPDHVRLYSNLLETDADSLDLPVRKCDNKLKQSSKVLAATF